MAKLFLRLFVLIVGVPLVVMGIHALDSTTNPVISEVLPLVVLLLAVLFVTLSKKIGMPAVGKITDWGFIAVLILMWVLDLGKIELLFLFIYSIINILVAVCLYKATGKGYSSIWLFGVLAYLITVFASRVTMVNGDMNPTFLICSIVGAVIALIPCLFFAKKDYQANKKTSGFITWFLLGILCGFFLTGTTVTSMNVYLDSSAPIYEQCVIIEKDVDSSTNSMSYKFKVQKGEESFTIEVDRETYHDCQINDGIVIARYEGAFNQPYYVYEKE